MGDTYQYIGGERRGYFAYVDTVTHQMLIAEPGGEYRMRAVDPNDSVPPNDGRWLDEGDSAETNTGPWGLPETSMPVTPPSEAVATEAVTTETGDEK